VPRSARQAVVTDEIRIGFRRSSNRCIGFTILTL
jgi:hypothetical protein